MKKIALECKNVTKYFLKGKKKITVLNNLDYKFENGKVYAIYGKSGSGKTTLINILGLLKKSTKGNIILNGKDISEINENRLAISRNKEIGFVFQSYYLDPLMNATENVILPTLVSKELSKDNYEKAEKLLKQMDLEDRMEHFPKELSGGEQQRVAIARALINDPSIILADEPTGSLDGDNEENILSLLRDLSKRDKCVIIVTHSKNVAKYADVLLEIKKGKLEVLNEVNNKK